MSQTQPNARRRARAVKIALAALLLAVLAVVVLLFRRPHERPPLVDEEESLSPVEVAQRETQAWVTERMNDPEYREQLRVIDESRRLLATEANALETEVVAWQQKLAAENPEFAALIEKLAALRQQPDDDQAAVTATAEATQAIHSLMAQDPRGNELLARQKVLNARRETLQQKALRTVSVRMQRQQAAEFGQASAKPARAGDGQ